MVVSEQILYYKTVNINLIMERKCESYLLWRLDLQCLELVRALKETARLGNPLFTENPYSSIQLRFSEYRYYEFWKLFSGYMK